MIQTQIGESLFLFFEIPSSNDVFTNTLTSLSHHNAFSFNPDHWLCGCPIARTFTPCNLTGVKVDIPGQTVLVAPSTSHVCRSRCGNVSRQLLSFNVAIFSSIIYIFKEFNRMTPRHLSLGPSFYWACMFIMSLENLTFPVDSFPPCFQWPTPQVLAKTLMIL